MVRKKSAGIGTTGKVVRKISKVAKSGVFRNSQHNNQERENSRKAWVEQREGWRKNSESGGQRGCTSEERQRKNFGRRRQGRDEWGQGGVRKGRWD